MYLPLPLIHTHIAPDITEQLVESLLSQAHLCPLPLTSKPVFWELDHTLRLFPLPHLVRQSINRTVPTTAYCIHNIDDCHPSSPQLVLADHADQFHHLSNACNVVNPGRYHLLLYVCIYIVIHSSFTPACSIPYITFLKDRLQATSRLSCTHRRISMLNSVESLKLRTDN